MALTMTVPTTGTTYGEIIKTVNVGDVLQCSHAVTGSAFFTEGQDYTVVEGNDFFTSGMPVIKDNEGIEVPHNAMPFGRPLADLFVKVESAPLALVAMETPVPAPVEPLTDEIKEWAIKGMESELHDLNESWMSFNNKRAELNKFDEDDYVTFGDMTREQKADLLLAHHEGKSIQFHGPWTWGKIWITLESAPNWDDGCYYRVEPEVIAGITTEVKDLAKQYDELQDKLNTFAGYDEDWF